MKSLFYYLFGLFTALTLIVILFNNYADLYLDDYYIDLLYHDYKYIYLWFNTSITSIWIFLVLAFVYMLGRGTNHEKREPLLINKEKENE